jgi:hypothetical protein|tara:strand:+ start:189 stop:317 length:129 start_codon:yes stop_codon:yes gene_type:complete
MFSVKNTTQRHCSETLGGLSNPWMSAPLGYDARSMSSGKGAI